MVTTSGNVNLEPIFYPRSVALVGISRSNPDSFAMDFLAALLDFQFSGRIYPVNPGGGEVMGLKVYTSIEDIPDAVDYVISSVPARSAPGLVEECARKQVKGIHFFTAGFSETGEEEGIRLEAELVRIARSTGVRIIGPNCMGIYCPKSGLSFMASFPRESGPVGLICQSGGHTTDIINQTRWRGVRFSKVISYGNACDLNETDYLEYLAADPDTKIIALYLEGIKGGKRFRQAWDKAVKEKIVILLKAGTTEAGARAAESHTASLAGNDVVWDALCKQSGAIRVHSLQEMSDMLVTALFMPRFNGRKVALVGGGGGSSVLLTDEFESRGFRVPPFPDEIKNRIREFTPAAGFMLRNPVDYSQSNTQAKAISIISEWEGVDFIVAFLRTGFFRITEGEKKRQRWLQRAESFLEAAKLISKPMAMVLEPGILPEEAAEVFQLSQRFTSAGLPVYHTFMSAARALSLYWSSATQKCKSG